VRLCERNNSEDAKVSEEGGEKHRENYPFCRNSEITLYRSLYVINK